MEGTGAAESGGRCGRGLAGCGESELDVRVADDAACAADGGGGRSGCAADVQAASEPRGLASDDVADCAAAARIGNVAEDCSARGRDDWRRLSGGGAGGGGSTGYGSDCGDHGDVGADTGDICGGLWVVQLLSDADVCVDESAAFERLALCGTADPDDGGGCGGSADGDVAALAGARADAAWTVAGARGCGGCGL